MDIGTRLNELIKTKGITQKDLALELNVASSTIGNYVNNNRLPNLDILCQMATYFNVSTDYLLSGKLDNADTESESTLLQIYRSLSPDRQKILIEIAQLLWKKEE